MEKLESFAQTYSQAPWRKQLQYIGLFSLALVFVALVAGIYLTVSANAAAVGRDIQNKQKQITNLDREIEDLQSQLASVLSSKSMEARAQAMGFQPIDPEQIVYVDIPGYTARPTARLAPASQRAVVSAPVLPEEYTESLVTWVKRQLGGTYESLAGLKP